MLYLKPQHFPDYELIDSGEFEKLERFGKFITIRPEPQAVWDRSLNLKEWEKRAHVRFIYKSNNSGIWEKLKSMPEEWNIGYQPLSLAFKFDGIQTRGCVSRTSGKLGLYLGKY